MELGNCYLAPWSLGLEGSILYPLLFSIYMKLLCKVIQTSNVSCYQFADNTQLYLVFPPVP